MLDCVIAGGRLAPDGRLLSRLADDLARERLAVLGGAPANRGDLLELLAGVSDGRPGQGRDHPVAAVLALAAAAVVAGSRSFTAIVGWAADVPAEVLEELYRRCGAARPGAGPPSKSTIWRVVTGADTAALDAVTGSWLMERAAAAGDLAFAGHGGDDDAPLIPVRVDGKTVRGARNPDGSQVHLLAALAGRPGVVAAQAELGAKTNEIPMIIPLLDGVDLDRAVVTADALHCQRATADYLHGRGADFILPAKDNQPRLFDALDALPWRDVPVAHAATDRGHGRIETRTIQLMDAPGDLPFPHVSQAYLIERHVTALDGTPLSDIAALGVTSLDATRASPQAIASLVRGQWAIESLHWLRDTLYREDNSTVRTRSGPRAMATLRNLAVGALHLAGRHDTTEATRWASRNMGRPFTILGLTSRSLLRPRATARKGQGSYQEVGQHQERCQIVAPISTMIGPPSAPAAASHRRRPALGKESPTMAESELFDRGLQARRDVLGAEYVDANLADTDEFMMAFQRVVTEWAWGYAWSRPGLDRKTRSMLNLAILTALGRPDELGIYVKGAIATGVSVDEIKEILIHATVYCGTPAGRQAFRAAHEALLAEGVLRRPS